MIKIVNKNKLTSLVKDYKKQYESNLMKLSDKILKKLKDKLKFLEKRANELEYLLPYYEVIVTDGGNLESFGSSLAIDYDIIENEEEKTITEYVLEFNYDLLENDTEKYLNDTVIHEFAHMVDGYNNYNEKETIEYDRKLEELHKEKEENGINKINEFIHNKQWLNTYIELGGVQDWDRNNFHYQETLSKLGKLHLFKCLCEDGEDYLSTVQKNEILSGKISFFCKCCEQNILPMSA